MQKIPPRYLVNPGAIETSTWTPRIFQFVLGHSCKNYLNSLWLGTVWNVLTLPFRLVEEVLQPLFNFQFTKSVFSTVGFVATVPVLFWFGITGRLMGINVSKEQAMTSIVLPPSMVTQLLVPTPLILDLQAVA